MCYHFIGFQAYDRPPEPRAMWRCSTCGRASQAPIDCCVRPSFAVISQPGIGHTVRQWLRAIATQAITGLASIRPRHRAPELDIGRLEAPESYMDIAASGPLWPETETEASDLQETTHASM